MQDLEKKKYHLEILKTIFGGIITVAAVWLGYTLQHRDKLADEQIEHKKTVVAERMKRYEEIAPLMNNLYCYFEYVGKWKEYSPEDIIKMKRDLDGSVYTYSILFDTPFLDAYKTFTDQTFQTFGGWGKDASLRTQRVRSKDLAPTEVVFTGEDNRAAVFDAYWALQKEAANALDSGLDGSPAGKSKASILKEDVPGR